MKSCACCAKRGLRVGFRGRRQRGNLRSSRWNQAGCCYTDLFAGGRQIALPAQAQGVKAHAWGHHILLHHDWTGVAVQSDPFETRCQIQQSSGCLSHTVKWSNFDTYPTSCTVFVCFFRQLLCNRQHLLCCNHPRVKMFCIRVGAPKCILTSAHVGQNALTFSDIVGQR